MKFLRRFIVLLMIIGVGAAVFSYKPPAQMAGEATEALKLYYHVKKADEINSQRITLARDGQELEYDPSAKAYMTQNMELTVPAATAARLLMCSVDKAGDDRLIFTRNGTSVTLHKGSDTYEVNGVSAQFTDPWIDHGGNAYVSVRLLAEAFDCAYAWNDEKNQGQLSGVATDGMAMDGGDTLPAAYDMRAHDRVTPVRNQGNLGTCWAFAALGALESSIMPGQELIFAIDHMSLLSGFNMTQQEGGDYNMALAYLAAWKGPVLESDDPYGDSATDASLEPVVHLQEAVNITSKDYTTIKKMIMDCGGVQSSFYSDMGTATSSSSFYNSVTKSYYYPGKNTANHDVVIVGWDDAYPRENFNSYPEADGAFICRNSWGTEFGDGGYFYVSYEDTNIGVNNMVYSRVDRPDNYGHIYQSDLLGWIGTIGYGSDTAWFANVYTAQTAQTLNAVSFYTTGNENYFDIFVVRDFTDSQSFGTMEYVKSGYIPQAGYYTEDLAQALKLEAGSRFAVIVRLTTGGSQRPVAIEYETGDLTSRVDLTDGEGYLSYSGSVWERMEDVYECNVCLKAFTDDAK